MLCICTHILAYSSIAWAAIEVCSEARTGTHNECEELVKYFFNVCGGCLTLVNTFAATEEETS